MLRSSWSRKLDIRQEPSVDIYWHYGKYHAAILHTGSTVEMGTAGSADCVHRLDVPFADGGALHRAGLGSETHHGQ